MVIKKRYGNRIVEEAQKKADEESDLKINQRFKEAAENRTDPKTILGFSALERRYELKICYIYPVVKEICLQLVINGFRLGQATVNNIGYEKGIKITGVEAIIPIYSHDELPMGSIEFRASMPVQMVAVIWKRNQNNHRYYKDKQCHMIQYFHWYPDQIFNSFRSLCINSKVVPTEAPPEWLMICADILKKVSPWGWWDRGWWDKEEFADARKYVNAMF